MICILKMSGLGAIEGWIIAADTHDARRLAESAGERDLASALYRMEFAPQPGKHQITPQHIMLVQ